MKQRKKRAGILIVLALLGGAAAWYGLDASAREFAHEAYHAGMALVGLDESGAGGATFWCPMHSDIRRPAPGTCPI